MTKKILICTLLALLSGFYGGYLGGYLTTNFHHQKCQYQSQGWKQACVFLGTPTAIWQGGITGAWTGIILGAFIGGLVTKQIRE